MPATSSGPLDPVKGEAERHGEEHAHLLPGDRRSRAVVPSATSAHHAAASELLDPPAERARGGDVVEHRGTSAVGRVERRIERPQREHRHRIAADGGPRTVVAVAASADDGPPRELLDPAPEGARGWDVVED